MRITQFSLKVIAIALCMLVYAPRIHAAADWSTGASACVPDAQNINAVIHTTNSQSVSFSGSNTGDIVLVCQMGNLIDGNSATSYNMQVAGDQDTTGSNYYVYTELRKFNTSTGTHTTISSLESDQNSYEQRNSNFADFTIDTDTEIYYMFVWLKRTGTLDNPIVYGINLF